MSSQSSTNLTPGIDAVDSRATERRKFAINLAIFLSVNIGLLIAWVGLVAFGVHATGLWVWPIVAVLWAIRIGLEGRAAYGRGDRGRRSYSEERIQRELRRMS
jgi:2TM domain-containing protein